MVRPIGFIALLVSTLFAGRAATSQDFRVYTRVYQYGADAPPTGGPAVVARSLSLFHAGKVYDTVDEIGEVVVFEPAHQRFTLLHPGRSIATSVALEEVESLLARARSAYEDSIDRTAAGPQADAMRFQLAPSFSDQFDREAMRLKLISPSLTYEIRCASLGPERVEALQAYLRYADWTSRLNYVLHPGALLPDSRIALNSALREKQLLPLSVELQADMGHPIRRRAEHQVEWQLTQQDRALIHHWESALRDPQTKRLPVHDYQRAIVEAHTARR